MKYISFTKDDDYASRKAAIARQEKLAEMLSQMGAQEQAVSTAGGITAPVSGMGALARGLTSFGGAYLSGKAAKDAEALDKASLKDAADKVEALYTMPVEGPTVEGGTFNLGGTSPQTPLAPQDRGNVQMRDVSQSLPDIMLGDVKSTAQGARPYEDQQRLLREYRRSSDPNVRQMATEERALIEAGIDRNKPTWRQPGDQLFTNEGVAVGTGVPVPPKTTRMPDGLGGYYEFTVIDGKTTTTHYAADDSSLNGSAGNIKIIDGITYNKNENGDWETNG